MSAITGTRVDEVLHNAVESGAVPNVVATAANQDGPIYEAANDRVTDFGFLLGADEANGLVGGAAFDDLSEHVERHK